MEQAMNWLETLGALARETRSLRLMILFWTAVQNPPNGLKN